MRYFDPPEVPSYGLASLHERPGVMPSYHRHREVELNFLENGSMTYLFSGRPQRLEAGRLAVFWAAYPHQVVRSEGDPVFYCLHVPLAHLLRWQVPGELITAILNGVMVIEEETANSQIDRALLPRWHEDVRSLSEENRQTMFLEIEARLRRLVWSKRSDRGHGRAHGVPGTGERDTMERITAYIAARYTESVTVEEIAAEAGLHPKYVMALFRKKFGMTIVEYLTQHRVSHAQRLLATTDQKVVEIGFDAGFGSTSRFYEAFERACGLTPREYRRSVQTRW